MAKHELLEYDWRMDGDYAKFCVDLSLYNRAADGEYPILVYVGCYAREEDAPLSAGELRHAAAFAAKCARKVDSLNAGFIETEKIRQYYLYVRDRAAYDALRDLAERERAIVCRVGGKKEPDWSSYFRILYPDAAKYQTVLNGEMLEQLYKKGDSDAPRRLNLHMYFPTDPARDGFKAAALEEGFAIGENEDRESGERPCGVVLHRICALKKWDVDAVTVQAIRLAEKYNGQLRFWDCPIVPARSM
ncbi:MAG: DUF695 domain-containing protein [Clostridia bacterium]|nr:DUF695 domain-containing protein [Clostridia bacterium]